MAENAFIGKTRRPADVELAAALGSAKAVWDEFLIELDNEFGVNFHEWKSYSPKAGWSLRVKRKERTIVWLSPHTSSFAVTFLLGDKAMRAARQASLPQRIVKALEAAPKYPEGTGVRLEVTSLSHIPALKKLAAIKLAN